MTDQRADIDSTVESEMEESVEQPVDDAGVAQDAGPEAADASEADASEAEALRQQLDEARIQTDEYLDQLRRTAAEFSNYKKTHRTRTRRVPEVGHGRLHHAHVAGAR